MAEQTTSGSSSATGPARSPLRSTRPSPTQASRQTRSHRPTAHHRRTRTHRSVTARQAAFLRREVAEDGQAARAAARERDTASATRGTGPLGARRPVLVRPPVRAGEPSPVAGSLPRHAEEVNTGHRRGPHRTRHHDPPRRQRTTARLHRPPQHLGTPSTTTASGVPRVRPDSRRSARPMPASAPQATHCLHPEESAATMQTPRRRHSHHRPGPSRARPSARGWSRSERAPRGTTGFAAFQQPVGEQEQE